MFRELTQTESKRSSDFLGVLVWRSLTDMNLYLEEGFCFLTEGERNIGVALQLFLDKRKEQWRDRVPTT